MAITVGTDTYITAAEADALLFPHPRRKVWRCESQAVQEMALVIAARALDLQAFPGRIADTDQQLAWPRSLAHDREGRCLDSTVVPEAVKLAQAELALHIMGEGFEQADQDDVTSIRFVGAFAATFDSPRPNGIELPRVVLDVLAPVMEPAVSIPLQF